MKRDKIRDLWCGECASLRSNNPGRVYTSKYDEYDYNNNDNNDDNIIINYGIPR